MTTIARTALIAAVLMNGAASAVPAGAQSAEPAPVPPAWTATPDEARGAVEIAAMSKDGAVRFVGGCDKASEPGLTGSFSGYRGDALRKDGQIDRVIVYASGEDWRDAFSVQLRYDATGNSWQIAKPLAPVFLRSFSRGGTLTLANGRGQDVFVFDLTGSTAAVRTMRKVCGFE